MYRGLTASLLREASYSSTRIGLYDLFKELLGHDPAAPASTPFWKRLASGLASGAVGAALANPTDLVKVRMQAFSRPGASRYRHTLDAFRSILREGGVRALWIAWCPPRSGRRC